MDYEYTVGARYGIDPQTAGEALAAIASQRGGHLDPAEVVQAARTPRHALHPVFEWDDARAAELHRVEQARHLIQRIAVRLEPEQEPVRAWVNIRTETESDYRGIVDVLSDAEMQAQLLRRALAEAQAWQRRYRHLEQLAEIFAALEQTQLALTG